MKINRCFYGFSGVVGALLVTMMLFSKLDPGYVTVVNAYLQKTGAAAAYRATTTSSSSETDSDSTDLDDDKLSHVFDTYSCHKNNRTGWADLHVCGSVRQTVDKVMFTTMYHSEQNHFKFENTVRVWSTFKGSGVQSVLLLSDRALYDNKRPFLRDACARGWAVLLAPACNKHGYPVLRDMFLLMQTVWTEANWYGFLNADVLFHSSFVTSLDLLHQQHSVVPSVFVVGRRHNLPVLPADRILTADDVMEQGLNKSIAPHMTHALDYFISYRDYFPWRKVPAFVVGRRGYDNWLAWFAWKEGLVSVDLTETALVAHQKIATSAKDSHSHRGSGPNYNMQFTGGYNYGKGCTACMSHMTRYVDTAAAVQGPPGSPMTLGPQNATALFPVLRGQSKDASRTIIHTIADYTKNRENNKMKIALFKHSKQHLQACAKVNNPQSAKLDSWPQVVV